MRRTTIYTRSVAAALAPFALACVIFAPAAVANAAPHRVHPRTVATGRPRVSHQLAYAKASPSPSGLVELP